MFYTAGVYEVKKGEIILGINKIRVSLGEAMSEVRVAVQDPQGQPLVTCKEEIHSSVDAERGGISCSHTPRVHVTPPKRITVDVKAHDPIPERDITIEGEFRARRDMDRHDSPTIKAVRFETTRDIPDIHGEAPDPPLQKPTTDLRQAKKHVFEVDTPQDFKVEESRTELKIRRERDDE